MADVQPTAAGAENQDGDHAHQPWLAHHFDSPEQQFASAKLGMWIFLVTEILFFGGLFCAYAVYRRNHPDIFLDGHLLLETKWGAINTGVLIFSSLTMALAVRSAQCNQRRALIAFLAVTILCACGFLGVKWIEYKGKWDHHLVPGQARIGYFFGKEPGALTTSWSMQSGPGTVEFDNAAAADTTVTFSRTGTYVLRLTATSDELTAYDETTVDVQQSTDSTEAPQASTGPDQTIADTPTTQDGTTVDGRQSTDSNDALQVSGGPDQTITDALTTTLDGAVTDDRISETPGAAPERGVEPDLHYIQETLAGADHSGAHGRGKELPESELKLRADNIRSFLGIYFAMTGLHGLHVVIGIGVLIWILVRSVKGHFSSQYFDPVDCTGLYWHLVDLIWIYLFPLLYLIH